MCFKFLNIEEIFESLTFLLPISIESGVVVCFRGIGVPFSTGGLFAYVYIIDQIKINIDVCMSL